MRRFQILSTLMRPLNAALIAIALATVTAGCAVNPATGERDLMLMSAADEKRLGSAEDPKIKARFGGVYQSQAIQDYVTKIGLKLAAFSELPANTFTFTILDSELVNAFALPGGYIYVTRGLIALAASEAELAGVLAHEIGHVTARHSAQRYSKKVVADLGAGLLGAITRDRQLADIAQRGGTLYLRAHSRYQEFQADVLGVRYLARAGYDTQAMARFLARMAANSRFQAQRRGDKDNAARFDVMATHPRTEARVRQARQVAQVTDAASPRIARAEFMKQLEGLVYGGSARHGFQRDRSFIHPDLGFSFDIPPGYTLSNRPTQVIVSKRNQPTIIFDTVHNTGQSPKNYLVADWGRQLRLTTPETITINGMAAATAAGRTLIDGQLVALRLIAIRFTKDMMARFIVLDKSPLIAADSVELRRTTYSFRRLSPADKATVQPRRITVETVSADADIGQLWRKMRVGDFPQQRFNVLNGVAVGRQINVGDLIKIVR